jgi:preprotein translocase subunit SecG
VLQIFFIINIVLAMAIVGLVLVQHGKGADMGAGLGASAGASDTVFGSQGSFSFLFKLTALLAFLFFANCIATTYSIGHRQRAVSVLDQSATQAKASTSKAEKPAAPSSVLQPAGVLPMQGVAATPVPKQAAVKKITSSSKKASVKEKTSSSKKTAS